jgi:hypothetical protein
VSTCEHWRFNKYKQKRKRDTRKKTMSTRKGWASLPYNTAWCVIVNYIRHKIHWKHFSISLLSNNNFLYIYGYKHNLCQSWLQSSLLSWAHFLLISFNFPFFLVYVCLDLWVWNLCVRLISLTQRKKEEVKKIPRNSIDLSC